MSIDFKSFLIKHIIIENIDTKAIYKMLINKSNIET